MSLFPVDDKARKMLPVFKMLTGYFPKAMREITKVCVANNVRYNPDRDPADINWARDKSPDQLGSAFRHIFERQVDGKITEDTTEAVFKATGIDRVYVLAEAAWRVCAALELEIEKAEKPIGEPMQNRVESDGQTKFDGSPGGPYGGIRTHQERGDAQGPWEETQCANHQQRYQEGSREGSPWCQTGEFCEDGEAPLETSR
jgi:hypothetical protein